MSTSIGATAATAFCGAVRPGFDPANPSNASTRMQGGLAVFENDNYRISAGDNNEVIIRNKNTGEVYRAWGDPHFDIDGKHSFDFWGTTTFLLDDGTKVTIETTPWGNDPTATLSSKVTITNGNYGVQITGVDTNTRGDLAIDEGKGWGFLVDAAVDDGNTLFENTFGKGFVAFDNFGRLQQVDQAYINQTDLLKGGQLQARYGDAFRLLGGLVSISFVGAFLGTLAALGMAAGERPRAEPQPAPTPWRPLELAGAALATAALMPPATLVLLPPLSIGLVAEYLQAGPVFTGERLKPKAENLNPVEGIKRMFTLDNAVEVLKALAKTALLLTIGIVILRALLGPSVALFQQGPGVAGASALAALLHEGTLQLLAWTLLCFVLVALLDAAWQRHSFTKKMRMSLRDIRQEMKEAEGDPHVKQHRRQAHQEWSERNAQQAARQASVLVVNPTHVAVAIEYDRETCSVPTVSMMGEDHVARAMREAAEQAGVPIVRNVPLARDLLARAEVGGLVPADLFDIVAEVILWAREVRDAQARGEAGGVRMPAPGEDMTRYAQGMVPLPGGGGQ